MPMNAATAIYRDWILGDPAQKEYWIDQIDWVDGHEEDFPNQTLVEIVAEMLESALTQDISELDACHMSDSDALFIRLLELSAGRMDFNQLALHLVRVRATASV
jgi:hypothetical protein